MSNTLRFLTVKHNETEQNRKIETTYEIKERNHLPCTVDRN